MSRCISSLKSMTHAQKARRLLENERIGCEIVGLDKNLTKNGCAFGISYECRESDRVKVILERRGLGYGVMIGKDGGD